MATEYIRELNGYPVEDATTALYIVVTDADLRGAKVGHPRECMYAKAIMRMYQSDDVIIYSTIAYCKLMNEEGDWVYKRYSLSYEAREDRLLFDKKKPVTVRGVAFSPPAGRALLGTEHHVNRTKRDHRVSGTARAKLQDKEDALQRRSGVGMVKFTITKQKRKEPRRDNAPKERQIRSQL